MPDSQPGQPLWIYSVPAAIVNVILMTLTDTTMACGAKAFYRQRLHHKDKRYPDWKESSRRELESDIEAIPRFGFRGTPTRTSLFGF